MHTSTVVYPISANPPTLGHADILRRACKKFKHVFWVAAINPNKKQTIPQEIQLEMMNDYVEHYSLDNVSVGYTEGSLMRYAIEMKVDFILRGVRNTSDLQAEMELAAGYRGINQDIETICFFANPGLVTISSSLVRELVMVGEKIDQYVVNGVAEKLYNLFRTPFEN